MCEMELPKPNKELIENQRKEKRELEAQLLHNITQYKEELFSLMDTVNNKWSYEDGIYRYYHQSFKVYKLQQLTMEIVDVVHKLLPDRNLNERFMEIINDGTGKEFTHSANSRWSQETRPIVEAFLHAKYMLEMIILYGVNDVQKGQRISSGWASIISLYQLW